MQQDFADIMILTSSVNNENVLSHSNGMYHLFTIQNMTRAIIIYHTNSKLCSHVSGSKNTLIMINFMEIAVLRHTGILEVSFIVRKRRLSLFGHVARLWHTVPANQILRVCTKVRDGERPSQERRACGRPPTTWIHQICRDTGVTATEPCSWWR